AFKALMEEQRVRARKAREALGDLGWAGIEFGKDMPATTFLGYTRNEAQGQILALVAEEELRDEVGAGAEAIVVLDQTPFYAEMGGQVADHGIIKTDTALFEVRDVQKNKGGKYMHSGVVKAGALKVGDTVTAAIDVERRHALARAHSATHLLQKALEIVLGDHVNQAGSLVEPDFLRFDFTHFSAMTPEELAEVSRLVNESILTGYPVVTNELSIEDAKKTGAKALFGEKYGDVVRVVDMGGYSVEFCGGTHLDNTAKAGVFHIDSEFSVASGVRRIEATTGVKSLETMNRNQELLFQAAAILKTKPGELREKAEQNMDELRQLRHTIEKYKAREAAGETDRFLMGGHIVGDLKVLTATLPEADANKLRQMGDMLRDKQPNVVAVLSSVSGEKITFLAVCGKEAVQKGVKAGDIIKSVTAICGGKGGGKPDSAMGGGSNILKLDDALASVDDFVAAKLGL
ncbi:MAG: alanine--tRNA ligase-related protein, partial [Clostridiales bacterium]|nr:alanine--tRNA ligase-related protein [Clostridiales bacterium]